MDNIKVAVGDVVAYYKQAYAESGYIPHKVSALRTVTRITPSGRIITNDGEFNPDGTERGQRRSYGWGRIRPMSREFQAEVEQVMATRKRRHAIITAFEGMRWRDLPDSTLEAVVSALETKE